MCAMLTTFRGGGSEWARLTYISSATCIHGYEKVKRTVPGARNVVAINISTHGCG